MDIGEAIFIVGVAGLCGIALFLLVGFPLLRRFAERIGGLYTGNDSSIRILPEYSVAEARVKQGKYTEAIEEYRKVIGQYPEDVYPHLRIAELALDNLHDSNLAELELLSAMAKAEREDTSALAAGRLADFYQHTSHDPARAIEVMRQLQTRWPATKHALGAQQRVEALEQLQPGQMASQAPSKITVKSTDEETLRRRRGF